MKIKELSYIRKRAELKKEAEELLAGTMKKQGVQCLITVCDRTTTNLAPVSGNPCMCLPAAVLMDEADQQPLSWYLMAGAYDENLLLRTAYVLKQAAGIRNLPEWTTEFGSD
ncbi:MAG: hypothetical protein IIY52_07080 [Solobacterium sp.]|nr:hypothetical protein [Solobacterium sp.]